MLLRIMLRWKSCLKTIKANKPEPEDATYDKVEDFNEIFRYYACEGGDHRFDVKRPNESLGRT